MVSVSVIDDNIIENVIKNFTASLTSNVPRIAVPDGATISIIDDENNCKQQV